MPSTKSTGGLTVHRIIHVESKLIILPKCFDQNRKKNKKHEYFSQAICETFAQRQLWRTCMSSGGKNHGAVLSVMKCRNSGGDNNKSLL